MSNDFNVNEEVLFQFTSNTNEVGEEPLFSSGNEEIDFIEPVMPVGVGSEVLMVSRNEIYEESLLHDTHTLIEDNSDVYEEVLFGAKGEDIAVENNRQYKLMGEELDFTEPVKPNYVDEEVLFGNVVEDFDEENDDDEIVDNFSTVGGILDDSLLDSVLTTSQPKKVYEDKTFTQKMLEADAVILERYAILKNEILKYKGVKSRISNNYDTFNTGRTQLFKMCTSGKSLKLYINLPYEEVESRLKCKYAGDKKAYEQVPTFLRIKSDRAFRNAKYLIGKVVERYSLKENKKFVPVDAIKILKEN